MTPRLRSSFGQESISTRLFHGPIAKREFSRAMDWVGKITPKLSMILWTGVRELAFPLRPTPGSPFPKLRNDLEAYANLFRFASRNFATTLSRFQEEIAWSRGRVFNNFFESVDAELYYSMIRLLRPSQVVEVGAGNSTWFAHDALKANGGGNLLAIDPSPRLALPRECQAIRGPIEDVDLLLFRGLRENDILFIDASHTKGEALYVTGSVYPTLHRGVFVHHHDISFPYLPLASVVRELGEDSEEPVVLDFLRRQPERYEVFTGSAFVGYENPDIVRRLVRSANYAPRWNQSSLWIKKVEDSSRPLSASSRN